MVVVVAMGFGLILLDDEDFVDRYCVVADP
ncbi:hypothetical protein COLO4_00291 [Corchorus olitorius]|uniref:Uncharacterized protein n=1 Tax=Corchorus olitorius TaxID=93759 RepID=A0A1R3L460_9ROSI|nr:hypothetical protein COLO4_00291 [Corchorus olitorius]